MSPSEPSEHEFMHTTRTRAVKSGQRLDIRPFVPEDARQVAIMSGRYFPAKLKTEIDLLRHRLVKFHADSDRSLVCSQKDGTIHGYLKVQLIPYRFRETLVTGAIFSDFMVSEQARRQLVPLRMLKQALAGPQDFSFSDDAAHTSRLLWNSLGGEVAYAHSTYYTLLLRPLSFAVRTLGRHARSLVQSFSGTLVNGLDRIQDTVGTLRIGGESMDLTRQPLNGEWFSRGISSMEKRYELTPRMEASQLDRLLQRLDTETEYGTPLGTALLDQKERLVGWYYCYFDPASRRCSVIHAESLPGQEEKLFQKLVSEARSRNCVALSGRLSPSQFGTSFSEKTLSRPGGKWSLIHSKSDELLRAVQSGRAFMSRCW